MQNYPGKRGRTFEVGEKIMAKDYRDGKERWTPGVVAQEITPNVTYQIRVGDKLWKRHTDQLLKSELAD